MATGRPSGGGPVQAPAPRAINRTRGRSSMVEPQSSKLATRVRFPSPAPRRGGLCPRNARTGVSSHFTGGSNPPGPPTVRWRLSGCFSPSRAFPAWFWTSLLMASALRFALTARHRCASPSLLGTAVLRPRCGLVLSGAWAPIGLLSIRPALVRMGTASGMHVCRDLRLSWFLVLIGLFLPGGNDVVGVGGMAHAGCGSVTE